MHCLGYQPSAFCCVINTVSGNVRRLLDFFVYVFQRSGSVLSVKLMIQKERRNLGLLWNFGMFQIS